MASFRHTHNVRRLGVVVVLLALWTSLGVLQAGDALAACSVSQYGDDCPSVPTATASGYRYVFDGHVFAKAPTGGTQEENGQQYTVNYTPVCTGNLARGQVVGDTLCTGAAAICPPGEVRLWQVLTLVPQGNSLPPTQICVGADDVVSLADLRAALHEQMEELLPKPAISRAPPNGGLVNLPVIVSTTEHRQEGSDVTVPLPGRVDATAVSYDWAFSDGGSASGAGRPYEAGITPRQAPSYYVTHTYLGTGAASATVTVVWNGTFTIGGYTVGLEPVTFTAGSQFPVFEARSQLIAGEE
jgi:hypothetical protein